MATGPTLKTARCAIEPFSEKFLNERYVAWLNDPEVVRHSEQRFRSHDLASCTAYMNSFTDTPNFFWAVVCVEDGLGHVGNINAYVDERNRVADVGIIIGEKRAWGTGLGSEAWLAVCRYLLLEAGMRKVTAGTLSSNRGMLGIMRKTGMIDDGRRVRQVLADGQEIDMVYAALFREDVN